MTNKISDKDYKSINFHFFTKLHDLRSAVDYNVNYSKCNCDQFYCRCSKIVSVDINEFKPHILLETLTAGIEDELLIYCIDRVIRNCKLDCESFRYEVIEGYYGEELDTIYLNNTDCHRIYSMIQELASLPYIDMIKYILKLEYGYLIKALDMVNNLCISNIDVNHILEQEVYRKKIDVFNQYYQEEYLLPCGIFIKKNKKFRLIDGYHRTAKEFYKGNSLIKGIVLW
jgi:hypothetical protein